MLHESQCLGDNNVPRASANNKQSDGSRMVHIRLDPDLHRRLRVVVAAEDTSVQDWVARVIGKAVVENWPDIDKRDTE